MRDHESVPNEPGLNEVEKALRGLAPSPSRLDRDALFFEAGRAGAARRRPGAWPSLALAMGLLALVEAGALVMRSEPRVVTRVVTIAANKSQELETKPAERPTAAPVTILAQERSGPALPPTYSGLEGRNLRGWSSKYNVDLLPEPEPLRLGRSGDSLAITAGQLLENEIDRLMNPGEPS